LGYHADRLKTGVEQTSETSHISTTIQTKNTVHHNNFGTIKKQVSLMKGTDIEREKWQ
jgi:hypothetical protein